MAEPTPKPRTRRLVLQLSIGLVLIALAVATAWYLTSPHFNDYVRRRVISQIERTTGGRVDMKALRWNLSRMTFETEDLTIHGLEGANEVPYVHADKVTLRAKIISLWRRDIALNLLELQHPVFHLITYPDGSTNQPKPKGSGTSGRAGQSPVEDVFKVALERVEARDGVLLLNDQRLPFELNGSDVQAGMTLAHPNERYDGTVHAGKLDMRFANMRPVSAIADAQFSLFAKRVEVKSLKVSTGRSQLEASGVVENFNDPRLTLSYRANVSLSEVGGITRQTQLRAGTANLSGEGTYWRWAFSTTGNLGVRDATFENGSVHVEHAAATADYTLDQNRLALKNINSRVLGGEAKGELALVNWTAVATARRPQEGTAKFHLTDVGVSQVVSAISTRPVPLAKMNLAGTASGDVEAKWKGSLANAIAQFALEVSPPSRLAPDQLPITARIRGTVAAASNRLSLDELTLHTRATDVVASGSLGSASSNLKVSLNTTDLAEWKPVLAAFRQSTDLPVDLHGSASFNGTVAGTLKSPAMAGHLDIRDFDSLIAWNPPPSANMAKIAANTKLSSVPPRALPRPAKIVRMHWDSLSADVQYSNSQAVARNGVLKHGTAQLNFDGSAALTKGSFTDTSPFELRATLRNASIADVQALAGTHYPVSGVVNLNLNVSGTERDPRGQGRVVLTNPVVHGEPFKQIAADIRFASQEAQFTNVTLAHNGASVTGKGAYNLTTRAFRFEVSGQNLDMASIRNVRTRFPLAGIASFTVRGSGTPDAPVVNGELRITNIVSGNERLGDIVADVVTSGDTLNITARSNYQNSDLRLGGTVRLRDDFPAQLTLQLRDVDIDPILRAYLKGQITGHSMLAGTAEVRGPLRFPKQLTAKGEIAQLSAEVEHIRLQNDGPIEFDVANEVLTVVRMRMVGGETDVVVAGSIQLPQPHRVDVRADGHVNLHILQTLNPDFQSSGTVVVNAGMRGPVVQPAVFGTLTVQNGAVSYIDLPNGLTDVNGTFAFNQDRLQIEQLTAHTGGGTLNLGGFITYGKTPSFDITARAHDMRLRYPQGVSSMADADLRLSGTVKSSLLSGDITVTKFGVNPRFDFGLYLARGKQSLQIPNPGSLLNNLRLDVHITSTPQLQVETSLAKVSGNADLRVRGTAARPSLLGRVSVIEGDVFFQGTKYHLERGDITFSNPVRLEPVIDLEARTTVRNYDITLGFHGKLDNLSVSYRSDPPLTSADIIQLLAFGTTQEEAQLAQQQSTFTESASNVILGQALNSALNSRMQRLFGVTRVKVDPRIGGAENNPSGAKVTIEQQVANNITLTYVTDLSRSQQQIIQVEYNINRNVAVTAIRDQNGVVSLDVRLRQRKK
jgi:translocation and assembly module TamB